VDWRNDLQISGTRGKSRKRPVLGLGPESKWEIADKINSEKIGMSVPPQARSLDEWAFLPLGFSA
jgi:hypothetical protein